MEKTTLPIAVEHRTPAPSAKQRALRAFLFSLTLLLCLNWLSAPLRDFYNDQLGKKHGGHVSKNHCKQVDALWPSSENDKLKDAYDFLFSHQFENASISRLSGAVQIKTESFDDLGEIGEDKRWDVFYPFHKYLEATFPRIHNQLKVEKVNTHGLVYTWEGSDEAKKPVVLMAHQDVVPVDPNTVDSWTHPPFSGHYDGKQIWGRGASDCKNQLIGLLETLEVLLEADYKPQRTIVLSFGFDEECSGHQGAGHLAPFLLERYGKDGVAAIVDEGMGYQESFGRGFAVPGVAEKGYTDVDITVRTPGGHSSVPRDHTSIGILSEIVALIEGQQYPAYLADANPILKSLQCNADYAPYFPKKLKKLLGSRSTGGKQTCAKKHHDQLAIEASKLSPMVRYLMQTSQSVDLIHGGTKTNAMPETAVATVNHRINIGDEPETVWSHLTHILKPVAKKYNLTLHAFDGEDAAYNAISLSARKTVLRTAPVTPTDIDVVSPYAVLSGTIRALFGEDTIVAPALMTGNTDTRYYWDLTKNIFRFGPGYIKEDEWSLGKIHTVDESITVSNHLKVVRWFTLFLRNIDEAQLEEA
ncbi:Putative peptidase M20, bacterial exopeptidase dimerization domain-containing protein [Septoria linicola]|uniref:Peptidase M20, bacterial exopeptidase dimerization domain-containing protein n=1 Tax=Septoria linicola TaxID=215465 RepID=A0A9Q9ASG9_9PEZI|nr:Putative peptidase M20, bacterial exopeptidase dimerization domain-containing protein [Septoria linicola]